ncbi:MAG: 4Fe-4S binding protein [Verrucomicrobiae bacterium]|nr:4Fe-4S binding protein [Verrucomicrobiae bacterium]
MNKTVKRKIIKIEENRCNGCGECVPNCPEGAIQIVNGKAKLVREPNCDGLGACIGHCPRGAISVEEREAQPYNEIQVLNEILKSDDRELLLKHIEHLKEHNEIEYLQQAREFLRSINHPIAEKCGIEVSAIHHGCPGAKSVTFEPSFGKIVGKTAKAENVCQSQLNHWPIQLHLINPSAQCYRKANLLVAADCVPFAFANFHEEFLRGKSLVIACPKLDHGQDVYLEKLRRLIDEAQVDAIAVMIMEVPCCFGLMRIVKQALAQAQRRIPARLVVVSIRGVVLKEEWIMNRV